MGLVLEKRKDAGDADQQKRLIRPAKGDWLVVWSHNAKMLSGRPGRTTACFRIIDALGVSIRVLTVMEFRLDRGAIGNRSSVLSTPAVGRGQYSSSMSDSEAAGLRSELYEKLALLSGL